MTVQAVITLPIIVMVTLIVVQLAVVWMAHNAAAAAAADGAAAAAAYTATPDAGTAAAAEFLRQTAGRLITDPTIRTNINTGAAGGLVTVTVTGHAYAIVPFLHLSVSATGSAPLENTAGAGR